MRDLLYPHLCLACNDLLSSEEEIICIACRLQLPQTDYHTFFDNPVAKHFIGKIPIAGATAMYHFNKSTRIQRLLHVLKYKHKPEVGKILGQTIGYLLKNYSPYSGCDILVPVPLHPDKEKTRGYNQSTMVAMGIADVIQKPVIADALLRVENTSTQTKKSRMERWENVKEKFIANNNYKNDFTGKHFMLIDDVITTGSTMEACAVALLQIPGAQVSIAAVAHAEY